MENEINQTEPAYSNLEILLECKNICNYKAGHHKGILKNKLNAIDSRIELLIGREKEQRLKSDEILSEVSMSAYILQGKSIGELMSAVELIAKNQFDGHYSIFSFTTNYRVGFGTITQSWDFKSVEACPTLKDALIQAILFKSEWN